MSCQGPDSWDLVAFTALGACPCTPPPYPGTFSLCIGAFPAIPGLLARPPVFTRLQLPALATGTVSSHCRRRPGRPLLTYLVGSGAGGAGGSGAGSSCGCGGGGMQSLPALTQERLAFPSRSCQRRRQLCWRRRRQRCWRGPRGELILGRGGQRLGRPRHRDRPLSACEEAPA